MRIATRGLGILVGFLLMFSVNFGSSAGLGGGSDIPYNRDYPSNPPIVGTGKPEDIYDGTEGMSDKILGIISVPRPENYDTSLGYAMALIQISINWTLGILSFVALVYMLYCGFLVFSSGDDDKNASNGKKGIKTAAIALAGIGLSWLIVSVMIWLITNISGA